MTTNYSTELLFNYMVGVYFNTIRICVKKTITNTNFSSDKVHKTILYGYWTMLNYLTLNDRYGHRRPGGQLDRKIIETECTEKRHDEPRTMSVGHIFIHDNGTQPKEICRNFGF